MTYKFTGDEIAEALQWLDEKGGLSLYQCDCNPSYDPDVNAYDHSEKCATHWEDHIEIMGRALKAAGSRIVVELPT